MLRRRREPTPIDPIELTRLVLKARRDKLIPNVWIDHNSWRIGETCMGDSEVSELIEAANRLWSLARAGAVSVVLEPVFEMHWIVNGRPISTTPRAIYQAIDQEATRC